MAVFSELIGLIIVTDDNKYEDKSQWDDDPERIVRVRLRNLCTGQHLYLQNEEGRTVARSTILYVGEVPWVGR